MELEFKARLLDLEAGGKYIVVMGDEDAKQLGVMSNDRVRLRTDGGEVMVILNTAEKFHRGVLGVYREVGSRLRLVDGSPVRVGAAARPESLGFIRSKIMGEKLMPKQVEAIVADVVERHLSDVELAAFVTALQIHGTSMEEVEALSRAMIKMGKTITFHNPPILDKHSIGGVPGDKTTLVVVPIIAAAGYTIPKSSSRAITSPAGTADRMEALCPVDLRIDDIVKVVDEVNACIVWGGSLDLAPADDLFIQVEYPLSIDPLLLPSIMSKKKAMGSTHVVVDIPTGREAKIKSLQEAQQLAFNFIELGNRLGMKIRCAVTEGEQPVGYAMGPALEAKEALQALMGRGPSDLVEKATSLAGILLEMMGEEDGKRRANEILRSGRAEEQMRRIIEAQGGEPEVVPDNVDVGDEHADLFAERGGRLLYINNKSLAQIARAAGAPITKGAGIVLEAKLGDEVKEGQPLFHIFSDNERRLRQAEQLARELEPIVVGGRIGERMVMMKISESTRPGAERYIIDR
jgi:AMP phosphorylase